MESFTPDLPVGPLEQPRVLPARLVAQPGTASVGDAPNIPFVSHTPPPAPLEDLHANYLEEKLSEEDEAVEAPRQFLTPILEEKEEEAEEKEEAEATLQLPREAEENATEADKAAKDEDEDVEDEGVPIIEEQEELEDLFDFPRQFAKMIAREVCDENVPSGAVIGVEGLDDISRELVEIVRGALGA